MRLAYVCLDPGVPVFGRKGSSVHCQEVIREFRLRGWEIEIFAARPGREPPPDIQEIPITRLAEGLPKQTVAREKSLIELNAVVDKALGNSKPFDLIYERYSLWSYSAMQFADSRSIPGVLEVNAPLMQEQKAYRRLYDESTARQLSELCFRHASTIIAVSQQVAAQISGSALVRNKIRVVPNGVDCERFDVPSGTNSDAVVVGFVGTLKPWHGVANLIDAYQTAFYENPNIKLEIIGSGPEEGPLRARLKEFSKEMQASVHWLGVIGNAEMPEALANIDIAVAPYPNLDNFYFSPLKILEYMAAGKAIVASRIGQIPKLLSNETALLVNPGDRSELANAITRLASHKDLRIALGQSAKQKAIAEHSWNAAVGSILATLPNSLSYCKAN